MQNARIRMVHLEDTYSEGVREWLQANFSEISRRSQVVAQYGVERRSVGSPLWMATTESVVIIHNRDSGKYGIVYRENVLKGVRSEGFLGPVISTPMFLPLVHGIERMFGFVFEDINYDAFDQTITPLCPLARPR